ncbi:MAG: Ig-like domain-containing protein, partial [Actinomycetota bacterium]|nr:Ig-like domain-containing protein [Actinomycetota bacterium]
MRNFVIDNTGPAAPSITTPAADTATNDTTPTLGGSAEAGSTVTLSDGGGVLGTTIASDAGVWAFTPINPLSQGAHAIVATATDPAGNAGGTSAVRTITIDTGTPDAPVITVPSSDLVTADQYITISGTAEPNSAITILDGASTIANATANGAGAWSF